MGDDFLKTADFLELLFEVLLDFAVGYFFTPVDCCDDLELFLEKLVAGFKDGDHGLFLGHFLLPALLHVLHSLATHL